MKKAPADAPAEGKVAVEGAVEERAVEACRLLCAAPDRLANRLQLLAPPELGRAAASERVGRYVVWTLWLVRDALSHQYEASVQPAARLLGQAARAGLADQALETVLAHLRRYTAADFLWRRVSARFVLALPDRAAERLLESALLQAAHPAELQWLCGGELAASARHRRLLTGKLVLFLTLYAAAARNLAGYLSATAPDVLLELLCDTLAVWSDRSALRHTTPERHLYLSQAVVAAGCRLPAAHQPAARARALPLLMDGVPAHLESASAPLRQLGVCTARLLTARLAADLPPLEIEYERSPEVEQLERAAEEPGEPPQPPQTACRYDEFVESALSAQGVEEQTAATAATQAKRAGDNTAATTTGRSGEPSPSPSPSPRADEPADSPEPLDSDDDLEPYDLSNDTPQTAAARPVYVRDLPEALLEQEDWARAEAAISAAAPLVRRQLGPRDGPLATEVLRALLHATDKFSLAGFDRMRAEAMAACVVAAPEPCAKYLTGEFYERNYAILQRVDMLDTLVAAARELSKLEVPVAPAGPGRLSSHWSEVVNDRLQARTRRLGSAARAPAAASNRFAAVAGAFFFPLLRAYDVRVPGLDLTGDEPLLLVRLLHALAAVAGCAGAGAPAAPRMAEAALQLSWALGAHREPAVRTAVRLLLAVTLASGGMARVAHLRAEMADALDGLVAAGENDSSPDGREMARQAAQLVRHTLREVAEMLLNGSQPV